LTSLFAPRAPIRATSLGPSASVGSLVTQSMGHTPKYGLNTVLCGFLTIPTDTILRHSISVPGTASSDDGLGGDGATVVDSPTVKKGSTQSSPTVKTVKA